MAKKPTEARRKLIEFDAQTWHALNLLSRESKKNVSGACRGGVPRSVAKVRTAADLKVALRESTKGAVSGRRHPRGHR